MIGALIVERCLGLITLKWSSLLAMIGTFGVIGFCCFAIAYDICSKI
jgi:hypothetical protein